MALKIRLRQQGRTNRQTYRLVVTDIRCPRDGKYLEMVGWYNPFSNDNNCHVQAERIHYWVGQGAQITPNAEALIKKVAPEVMKEIRGRQQEKQMKKAAKRRALKRKKKGVVAAQAPSDPIVQVEKEAPLAKEGKKAPKAKASQTKKAKAEE